MKVKIISIRKRKFMKRHGNLYSKITDINSIRQAYLNARKGKRWQDKVINFEKNLEAKAGIS